MPKRIGDVAKAGGVDVETVRFYEREGLIDQPSKPFRGWREYDDVALAQLNQVRLAQRNGLSLSDTKKLKKKAGGSQHQFCAAVRETVVARLTAVELEISELMAKRDNLQGGCITARNRMIRPVPTFCSAKGDLAASIVKVIEMTRIPRTMLWLALMCSPAVAQERSPQTLVDRFMRAWDASDPKAISALFTEDGDLVAPDGIFAKGRPAVEAYYSAAFASGYARSKGAGQIVQQRALSSDLVLIDSRFSIVGAHNVDGSAKADEKGAMAVIIKRVGGNWQIVALRERSDSDFIPFPPVR